SDFTDQKMGADHLIEPLHGENRIQGMLARHEIFGLQFLPGARGESHAEVRQALIPRPWNSHLSSTVLRRKLDDRVQVSRREFATVKLWRSFESHIHPALDPDLIDAALAPVGEKAHAVPSGFDRIEILG